MYLTLKSVHVTMVLLSISLFSLRGLWMLRDSSHLRHRWVAIVPHIIDTVLLLSALSLAVLLGQYPFIENWLTAKVLALLVYVGLGTIALKRGRTKTVKVVALVGALLIFAYIVSVAITRSAMPLLSH